MDDGDPIIEIVRRVTVFEDESLDIETIQDLGTLEPGTEVLFFGFMSHCAYDDEAGWPQWPLHDFDTDNDGIPDTQITYNAGWYAGDVDWIGLTPAADGRLEAKAEWTNSPSGGTNAAYKPDEPDGLWASESDLDLVVFDTSGAQREVVNESGISNSYPQTLLNPGILVADAPVALAIGCHHATPTDYDLRLVIR
jgi:hypothetical protein